MSDRVRDKSEADSEADSNDSVWKSERGVADWVSGERRREQRRSEQRRLLAELLPFGEDEEFRFVDLGAGTGAAARAVLDYYPRSSAVLADFSPQMREQAAIALGDYAGRYVYLEYDLRGGPWPEVASAGVPAVITSLCVHHLPDERKGELFAEIFAHLTPGGWYLNFDAVSTDDPLVAATWKLANDRQDPETAARQANLSPEERLRHENHLRHMIPLEPQLELLRAAGFEGIDLYWKQLDFVIYGGRRPAVAG